MQKYITRLAETNIEKTFKRYKVLLITGARQVGKTRLIKELYKGYRYINFDDTFMVDDAIKDGKLFLSTKNTPLILDEIQRVPSLFRFIKLFVDENDENSQYILSGSQLFRLMEKASDSLSGRVHIIELPTLSLREINNDLCDEKFLPTKEYIKKRKVKNKSIKNIWKIIHNGFYPAMQDKNNDWYSFYTDYLNTYVTKDVRELTKVRSLSDFRNFMIAVASRTGQILNMANIASEVGKDINTIKEWISILETSGIIYLLMPYANSELKRAIKSPKIYFRDTGMCSYLTRWLTPETLENGNMRGAMFETFVVSEILKSYANAGYDYRHFIYYYNGRDNKKETESEIDMIIEENGIIYPIEIKMTTNPYSHGEPNFEVLGKIKNKKIGEGAIISMVDDIAYANEKTMIMPYFYI